MRYSWKEALQLAALGVGVTLLGLVVGAFVMSPAVSRGQRLTAFIALGGAAGLVLLVELAQRALQAWRRQRQRRGTARTARPSPTRPASAGAAGPLRSTRGNRTPRTVQALAAAGTAPTDIAWKTGLPLDAVSMLLEINGGTLASR